MKPLFAPSLMCMDLLNMKTQLEVLNRRADLLHVDIMDGHFCPNLALSPAFMEACRKCTDLPMDVHLMTTRPGDWLDKVAKAGATYISPHAETINSDAFRTMQHIRELGCKTGVVLNPATPLEYVDSYLDQIDLLTIMTIDTGFAGQKFIDKMLEKITQARRWREEKGYHYLIQIDGACNKSSFKKVYNAGCEIFIVGTSGVFSLDPDLDVGYDKMLDGFQKLTDCDPRA